MPESDAFPEGVSEDEWRPQIKLSFCPAKPVVLFTSSLPSGVGDFSSFTGSSLTGRRDRQVLQCRLLVELRTVQRGQRHCGERVLSTLGIGTQVGTSGQFF